MARLERLGLVQMAGEQPTSQGPARSLVKATRAGRTAARGWLHTPVAHGRDVRSELMIKLALLERAGADPWLGTARAGTPGRGHVSLGPAAADLGGA